MERLPSTSRRGSDSNFRNYQEEERYIRARKKVESIKGFYGHLISYIIINIFILALIGFNLRPEESFWQFGHFSTAFFWGIGLAFHAFGVFGKDWIFGRQWEARKMQEYLSDDRKNWE